MRTVHDGQSRSERSLVIGVMGSASGPIDPDVARRARDVGRAAARAGCILITGACPGLPQEAVMGASSCGGLVLGISPALSEQEHVERYASPTEGFAALVYTGSGLMGREVLRGRLAPQRPDRGHGRLTERPSRGPTRPPERAGTEGARPLCVVPHPRQGAIGPWERAPGRVDHAGMRAIGDETSSCGRAPGGAARHRRTRLALVVSAVVLAAGAGLAVLGLSTDARSGAGASATGLHGVTCAAGNVVAVYPQQDDGIIFMNPTLQRQIATGACVTVLELTAGTVGDGAGYWVQRNIGEMDAFGTMAHIAGVISTPGTVRQWTTTSAFHITGTSTTGGARTVSEYYLQPDPKITIIQMLLPTGAVTGSGFAGATTPCSTPTQAVGSPTTPRATCESIYKLRVGKEPTITSRDTRYTNTWTQPQLVQFISDALAEIGPERVMIQDATLPSNSSGRFIGNLNGTTTASDPRQSPVSDHSDHITSAKDTLTAAARSPFWGAGPWLMVAYRDYTTAGNQFGFYATSPTQYRQWDTWKWEAWDAYYPHDSKTLCRTASVCKQRSPANGQFQWMQSEWTASDWSDGLGSPPKP